MILPKACSALHNHEKITQSCLKKCTKNKIGITKTIKTFISWAKIQPIYVVYLCNKITTKDFIK